MPALKIGEIVKVIIISVKMEVSVNNHSPLVKTVVVPFPLLGLPRR